MRLLMEYGADTTIIGPGSYEHYYDIGTPEYECDEHGMKEKCYILDNGNY